MKITNAQRAEILVQALPYIQKYSGKTIVVKYGGNAMVNKELKQQVMGDIALLSQVGIRAVLVHGGGPEITSLLEKVGNKSEFVDGLRVTDGETMIYAQMALAGKVNKSLVNLLQSKGGKAMGISGMDGRLIQARVKDKKLGYVGEITSIDPTPILDLLEKGYTPVVSSLGCDTEGNVYNINADTAAAGIAGAIGAECLISMTNIAGILRDKDDPSTLIPVVDEQDAQRLREEGVIAGGMIPKVECCIDALRRGVSRVFILDGRLPHAILVEILTDEGAGTMFVKEKAQ